MMDIETQTVIYLRDLLATRPKLPDGSTPMPARPNRWRNLRVRVGVGTGLGIVPTTLGPIITPDFAAIHMMWGAVNELTTLTGYHALMRRCGHPAQCQRRRPGPNPWSVAMGARDD
jgi:hypothetical protein